MKAEIILKLTDKNRFNGKLSGTILDASAMMHRMAQNEGFKSAVLLAASAIMKDMDKPELQKQLKEICYDLIKE